MALDKFWKDRESYSILELAYIACEEEPQSYKTALIKPPQKVVSVYRDMMHLLRTVMVSDDDPKIFKHVFIDEMPYFAPKINYPRSKIYRDKAIWLIDSVNMPNFLTSNNKKVLSERVEISEIERHKMLEIMVVPTNQCRLFFINELPEWV